MSAAVVDLRHRSMGWLAPRETHAGRGDTGDAATALQIRNVPEMGTCPLRALDTVASLCAIRAKAAVEFATTRANDQSFARVSEAPM